MSEAPKRFAAGLRRALNQALFPLLAWTGVLVLAGCARRDSAVEAGNRAGVLHVGNAQEPADLDPHTNNAFATSTIGAALFEGLVRLSPDGKSVRPGVAERWEISADGREYTFRLRQAQWSNGEPIVAADFVALFRRFLEPKLGCEGANLAFAIVGARDFLEGRTRDFGTVGVEAPDERTVVIRLRYRAPYFLTLLADPHLVPVHGPSLDRFEGREKRGGKWTQPGNLVSNGPFVLKEWRQNHVIAVARNPRYWDAARVELAEIRFYPIEDAMTEERAYRSGQLHVTYTVPFTKLPAYAGGPDLRAAAVLGAQYITFGVAKPPFNDPRVRRAFSLAIDRERLTASVLKGRAVAAYTYAPPQAGGYGTAPQARFDAAEAKRLLAAAGFPGGAGLPALELTVSSRTEEILSYAQALQQMWRQTLGVQVELAPMEFKVWLDVLRNKSFLFTTDSWNMSYDDPVDMLAMGVTGDPNNDAGWSLPAYDAAFARIEAAPDDTARRAAILECEQLIAAEAPYAPVYFLVKNQLVHPAVQGWVPNHVQRVDWTGISLGE